MDRTVESLKKIGYSEKEAITYIALLQMGRGTAYSIAEKSGLKKPTTHVILGELLKKGAVIVIPGSKRKMFAARHPEDVFSAAQTRITEAKEALGVLSSLMAQSRSEIQTIYFEGLRGVKEALYYKMNSCRGKEILGFFATAENVLPETMLFLDKWGSDLKKEQIKIRGFTTEDETTERYRTKNSYQEIKFLPKHLYSSKISIETQGDFVRITDIQRLQSIIIENPQVAQTLKQIFEIVWENFKK